MIAYYLKKIATIFYTQCLRFRYGLKQSDGILEGQLSPSFKFRGQVVLAFWDGALVHLGDQLFYLGIVVALQNSGIQVRVVGPTRLSPIFESFGAISHSIKDTAFQIPDGAFVLSKFDMLPQVISKLGTQHYFMGMNYWKMKGSDRVCALIANATLKRLSELGAKVDAEVPRHLILPKVNAVLHPDVGATLSQSKPNSILLFNDVVASNYIEARKQRYILTEWAKELKDRGYSLLYIGAPHEIKRYPLPDIAEADWRAKLPPLEFMAALQHDAVAGVLSFDTFIAHAATLTGKSAFVVSRTVKKAEKNANRLMPMFELQARQKFEMRK